MMAIRCRDVNGWVYSHTVLTVYARSPDSFSLKFDNILGSYGTFWWGGGRGKKFVGHCRSMCGHLPDNLTSTYEQRLYTKFQVFWGWNSRPPALYETLFFYETTLGFVYPDGIVYNDTCMSIELLP